MPSTSRNILDQLTELQSSLEGFSFDYLSTEQALELKNTFDAFRDQLEGRIWSPQTIKNESLKETYPRSGFEARTDKKEPQVRSGVHVEEDMRAEEASDNLIALVSHEIRTPLNGIQGFSDLLRETRLDADQRKCVEAIRSASGSMLEMVNALLDYHKVCRGLDKPVQVSFSPAQVLEEVRYLSETLILDTQLRFDFRVAEALPAYVLGDPSRFSQILINLLGNAIKFTKEGEIGILIKSSIQGNVCEILCEVSDTGPGIPEEDIKRIFQPYAKVRNRGQISGEGLGLGLSLVYQWTQQMDGEVSVKSRESQGSTFRLRLPFTLAAKEKDSSSGGLRKGMSALQDKHILIFEDNPLNMKLAETRLKGWGCVVYQALHFQTGLQLLDEQAVDLILMDLRMPGMDGYEVSKRIRNHEDSRVRMIPIVALTADFTKEVQQRISQCGIDDLVLKPYTPEELSESLLKCLKVPKGLTDQGQIQGTDQEEPQIVSLERLWEDCNNDREMMEEMVRLFLNGVLEFLGALAIHSKAPDYKEIRAAAHKVKAGLKLLEARSWVEHVEQIQELARGEKGAALIRGHYEALKADFPRMEASIAYLLNKRKSGGRND